MAVTQEHRQVAYANRTGAPEGLPRAFIPLVLDNPERVYGTWWYIQDNSNWGESEGWYIWIQTRRLLGVSRGSNVAWRVVNDFEMSLVEVTNMLWRD